MEIHRFKLIINKNFKKIKNNHDFSFDEKIELIRDFDHNFIILVNGLLNSFDISFEDKSKVNIEKLNSLDDFKNQSSNNLNYLNKALSLGGFKIEIKENYKCKKPIIIYNYYSSNLENKIINNSNKIKLNQNTELTLIEYNVDENSKFLKNTFETVEIAKDSVLKSISFKNQKSKGYFYKNISGSQGYNSKLSKLYFNFWA